MYNICSSNLAYNRLQTKVIQMAYSKIIELFIEAAVRKMEDDIKETVFPRHSRAQQASQTHKIVTACKRPAQAQSKWNPSVGEGICAWNPTPGRGYIGV